jgi:AbrB family looped-hinge helix DNA binding protein
MARPAAFEPVNGRQDVADRTSAAGPGQAASIRMAIQALRPLTVRLFCLTCGLKREAKAMSTLTVTAKGQVTLRKDLLKHLGIQPGDKVVVNKLPDGRIEVKAARPTGRISDVFDFLKRENGPSLSIEDMNEIAAQSWAGKRWAGRR